MLDDTSFGELATNMQSWKCGEAEMGHRSFEEESATSTADREKLGGDGENYTIYQHWLIRHSESDASGAASRVILKMGEELPLDVVSLSIVMPNVLFLDSI